jgi:hypothetical protein
MRIRRASVVGVLVGAVYLAGCASHAAYGPSSDQRLDSAVKEGATDNGMKDVTADQLATKKCGDYRAKLIKAKSDDVAEVDRLAQFESLYKDLKEKNDFLDQALAANPDLQFANESQVPKIRDECVAALAEVRQEYYAFVADISDLLVVKDTHGNPSPRLDFKRFREAITVLDPDDRDQLLGRVDAAERRIKTSSN